MPKVVVEESRGNFIETNVVREGTYIATLEAIREGTLNWNGEERPVFRWFFRILDRKLETDDGRTIYPVVEGLTSNKFSTRSNAYKWFSALTGRRPAVGEEVELEEAIGGLAQIVVKNKTSRNGRTYSRVVEVVPLPEGVKKYAQQLLETYKNSVEEEEQEIAEAIPDYEDEEEPEEEEEEPEELIVPKKPKKTKKVRKG
jgi:hypothetical protein